VSTAGGLGLREIRRQLGLFTRDPELRSACAVDFCAQAVTMFYNFFIAVIAIDEFGLGVEQATGLVGEHGLAYVLSLLTLGGFASRAGSLQSYLVSGLILGGALLALCSAQASSTLWPGGVALGAGLGLLQIVNLMRFARLGARVGRAKIAGLNALVGPRRDGRQHGRRLGRAAAGRCFAHMRPPSSTIDKTRTTASFANRDG
jgi:predicted MFS family arabinose efflux permease